MKAHPLLILFLWASASAIADTQRAATLMREGRPADALGALQGESSSAANYWRGRALIELGRLKEAAVALHQIPSDHALYPYAAKGLLYCAWKSNSVDFAVIATPMATSSNQEIATLATAALAEYWLRQPSSQDNSALERLRQLAQDQTGLQPLLRLLEIDNLRLRGEFEKAIEQCRILENDRSLPLIMRQRARLALSEVYYAKEAAEAQNKADATPEKSLAHLPIIGGKDDQLPASYDDGKGEETLLHFISSHPDSPLLEEAFRRLHERNAFRTSEYAGSKLKEWMAEPLKSRRASIALLIQQHLQTPEGSFETPLDVSCANTAAATCPHEPATRIILLEQTRWFLEREQTHEALLYLGMIQRDDVFRRFYENQLHSPSAVSTARSYLDCARSAPESLRTAALTNALVCALISGDEATQEAVINMQDVSEEQHYSLFLTRIAYWLDKDPARAQADIDLLKTQPAPNKQLQADLEMDQAYLFLQQNPAATQELLNKSDIGEHLTELTEERQLRFFALQEEASRKIASASEGAVSSKETIDIIKQAAKKVRSPRVLAVLTLHLASLQSAQELHVQALQTITTFLRKYPRSDYAERARYMAARESEFIGTQESLQRAAVLYETCAERSEDLAIKAGIRHAAVLLRLGHHDESEHILVRLMRKYPDMRPEDRSMANSVLANNKALLGTKEGRAEAISIVGRTLQETGLPVWWRYRVLLHHATLCSRDGRHEEALRDYEEVLSMKPATGEAPTKADWHILYSAGSGAVMQLLYLKRYNEAAEKCDRIADWNKEKSDLSKREQFSNWAQYIRQTDFVNNDILPF